MQLEAAKRIYHTFLRNRPVKPLDIKQVKECIQKTAQCMTAKQAVITIENDCKQQQEIGSFTATDSAQILEMCKNLMEKLIK